MAFRIDHRETETTGPWTNQWRFPERAHFIKSNAYETFLRELRRYVLGEVAGRSFLIAGHRGAGKTSLVRRAVEDLNRDLIGEAYENAALPTYWRQRVERQRPLLVRLHGPSLLDPEKAPGTASDPATTGKKESEPSGALVQITIALYRALAAEYSRSFANYANYQAGAREPDDITEYHELAAQFTLELDNFPKPAILRDFYRRLGRMGTGILWPDGTTNALPEDRGLREIIALTTASQAFAVCTGDISKTTTENNARKLDESLETKGEATLKDVANKLTGLAAGVGAGLLTQASLGTAGAAGVGLAAGILSTLTLTWTNKRSRTREQKMDYTFIIKPDKQSLERDLPLVIERVREAGLAPVFVLDELDKVDKAETEIASLVKRLKHLTTDFGCFCFLTDRDYYDGLVHRVDKAAFPVEHSFFSHLLFILPHPDRCLIFLRDITRSDPPDSPLPAADEAARSLFGLFVLHRSKLNMVEVLREIAGQCGADGTLRLTSTDLRRLEYAFAASIQLAIGFVLKSGAMYQRVEADPSFMQWAVDALYILSRAWEAKEASVKLDRASIVRCLLARKDTKDIDPDPKKAERMLAEVGVGGIDLDILDQQVGRLAELLSDSAKLKSEIAAAGSADLADLIPSHNLIKRIPDTDREFEFLYDMYGEEVAVSPALTPALVSTGLPAALADRIDQSLEILDAFAAALAVARLEIPDLIALQILPATIEARELYEARDRLLQARTSGVYERLSDDLFRVGAIAAFLEQSGAQLAAVLRLATSVAADARDEDQTIAGLRPALAAVARHVDLRSFFQQLGSSVLERIVDRPADVPGPVPIGSVQSLRDWRDYLHVSINDHASQPPRRKGDLSRIAWEAWSERIRDFLSGRSNAVDSAIYADIVCAAANLRPGNIFQRELGQITIAEWSEICLLGFPQTERPNMPAWTFLAGLSALGFGKQLIRETAQNLPQIGPGLLENMVQTAQASSARAHFLVMRGDGRSIALHAPKRPLDPIVLALPEERVIEYSAPLDWLANSGAFQTVVYEVDDPALLEQEESPL